MNLSWGKLLLLYKQYNTVRHKHKWILQAAAVSFNQLEYLGSLVNQP